MFQAAWPPLAILSLFVVVVIILILKFGHRCFGARVTTLPQPWERGASQYQYQMQVLDTSHKEAQPFDTHLLHQHQQHEQQRHQLHQQHQHQDLPPPEVLQYDEDDMDTRLQYGAGEQYDYQPQFESHSKEAAV